MKYCRTILLLIFLTTNILIAPSFAYSKYEQERKIVVLPFSCHNASHEADDIDVGAEVAKVLSVKIAHLNGWTAISNEEVWNLLESKEAEGLSGIEIGRLLGADAVIVGSVQSFNFAPNSDMNPTSGASLYLLSMGSRAAMSSVPYAGAAAGIVPMIAMMGFMGAHGTDKGHAQVIIDAKLIDIHSGKTLCQLSGDAKSKKCADNLWDKSGPNPDFLSASFTNSIAGQATFAACDNVCKQLVKVSPIIDVVSSSHALGQVHDIDGNLICICSDKTRNLKVGDKLSVESQEAFNQPRTHIGTVSVIALGANSILAKQIDGNSNVEPGDTVYMETPRLRASL